MLQRVRSFFVRESMCCNCQFTGEIRMLPCPEDGMLHLCRRCFDAEIDFRARKNRTHNAVYDLPAWESLERA